MIARARRDNLRNLALSRVSPEGVVRPTHLERAGGQLALELEMHVSPNALGQRARTPKRRGVESLADEGERRAVVYRSSALAKTWSIRSSDGGRSTLCDANSSA